LSRSIQKTSKKMRGTIIKHLRDINENLSQIQTDPNVGICILGTIGTNFKFLEIR
jgi:hypothetical protein